MTPRTRVRRRESATLARIRGALLVLFLIGASGTAAELVLLEHTEDPWQWTPLALIAIALAVLAWRAVTRSAASLRAFQLTMVFLVISGVLGLYHHYRGNVEFELEMYPSLSGLELFGKSLQGATPTLAPGTMIQLGLLGLAYAYRHPATTTENDHDPIE